MQTNPVDLYNDAKRFTLEVRSEFKKVTWPSQKEAMGGTIGVIVVVAIITTVLSLVDAILGLVLQFVVP